MAAESSRTMTGDRGVSTVVSIVGDSQISFIDDDEGKKEKPSFMQRRRGFTIIHDGLDLTPEDIIDPNYSVMDESAQHAAFDTTSRAREEIQQKIALSRSKMALAAESVKVFATTIHLDDIHIDHTLNTEEGIADTDVDLEQAPSAFYLPKLYPLTSYPKEINIVLKETPTHFIIDLPMISFEKGSPAGTAIEEENAFYEYITVGKGSNRKMVVEETQSESIVTQTRHTLVVRPQKKNVVCFASMWDMHDTYARLARETKPPEPDEMVLYQSASPAVLRKKKNKGESSERSVKTFEDVASKPEFFDCALITERVLASLDFDKEQKIYRGLVGMDPLSLDLVYIYTLKPLWTFECPETENKPILDVSFNPKNNDILAVAHGKFTYADEASGIVCVWCTKNPTKPERLYRFESSVTSVGFSEKNPNWLAVGFANGDLIVIDITSYPIKTIATSSRETNPCFEPVWNTTWRSMDRDSEYIMACCQDGRINKFTSTKTHELLCSPMMRVCATEGKLKGIETIKNCTKHDVPMTRYPGVQCKIWHPTISHIYLVGTDEGCVHRCSTHYLNQHIDVFRAHAGPVYDIQICPFNNQLFATSGADCAVRLWMEGMDDVILTLLCPAAVHGVAFCPINSTLILTASGNTVSIWDLRRKSHEPCAEYTFPVGVVLTYVHFSPSGHNVYVCDTIGRIHTFHLEDTPIPAFYQRKMLDEAIRNALCTRPHLLKQLEKIERNRED